VLELEDAPELAPLDVDTPFSVLPGAGPRLDRRAFEARYADLGFGLGVVPRRQHRDEPFWETPTGVLTLLGTFLVLLGLFASAR
jgi:hypothetical protein